MLDTKGADLVCVVKMVESGSVMTSVWNHLKEMLSWLIIGIVHPGNIYGYVRMGTDL